MEICNSFNCIANNTRACLRNCFVVVVVLIIVGAIGRVIVLVDGILVGKLSSPKKSRRANERLYHIFGNVKISENVLYHIQIVL